MEGVVFVETEVAMINSSREISLQIIQTEVKIPSAFSCNYYSGDRFSFEGNMLFVESG